MTETRQTSPGVSMTTIRPAGQRPVCAGCSTTYGEHCQTCGTCPTVECPSICADMKVAEAAARASMIEHLLVDHGYRSGSPGFDPHEVHADRYPKCDAN